MNLECNFHLFVICYSPEMPNHGTEIEITYGERDVSHILDVSSMYLEMQARAFNCLAALVHELHTRYADDVSPNLLFFP